ncbi:MAG TPA: DUF4124 domain-containing protein [Ramlibacter sp.]|uniref:DUF4124 domain-containing protein n=1 Tax=Ramlibacter sp. TaxID=1917967 RepID=UPI002C2B2343|nr:DUF4124 domain-containing protein [Ramlibacter sp.]HVZ44950.1 DUF4124 domain-containing protein [Ramlibacter sp.]
MKRLCLLFAAAACVLPAVATAQWQWIDKSGHKVFSDQPPPVDIPASNILRQPGKSASSLSQPPAAAAPAAAPTPVANAASQSAPKLTGKEKELEDRKKQAEAQAAARKKQQEEERQAIRADNCARAKRAKATYDSGVRVARTNDKGEREVMDDAQRAEEVKHLEAVIARDCSAPTATQ